MDQDRSDPHEGGARRVIFLSGDTPRRSPRCSRGSRTRALFAINLGGLVAGGAMQQLGGPLAGLNLIQLPQAT
jgi:hypothetical protein